MFHRRPQPIITTTGGRQYVLNYNVYIRGWRPKKRALLAYIPSAVIQDLSGDVTNRFSNAGIALSWPRVLNEMGYIVDIISWDDTDFIPKVPYDVVIFHGGRNFEHIRKYLVGNPKIIHFSTGGEWRFNNEQEDARRKAFAKRHGVSIARDRYIEVSEDTVNMAADAIIVVGNPSLRETYAQYPQVYTIYNASYPDDHFDRTIKDYAITRRNFLFFAGAGNIHKGLDLAIEAFKDMPDRHLYIVTVLDPPVLRVFAKEIKLPNIHVVGEVNMRTKEFYDIIDTCAFCILPSFSEGQAGSIVECMNQGLIPVVTKETRLDARTYGRILPDASIATIQKVVQEVGDLPPHEVAVMARAARKAARKEHSPLSFRKDLRRLLGRVLSAKS